MYFKSIFHKNYERFTFSQWPHSIMRSFIVSFIFDLLFKYKHDFNSFRAEMMVMVLFFVEIAIQYDEN